MTNSRLIQCHARVLPNPDQNGKSTPDRSKLFGSHGQRLWFSRNNFIQTSTGILSLQIGGSSPGNGYSQLVATGSANLDGTLKLSLVNGFTPYNGEEFVILTSTDLIGTFSNNTIQDGNVTFTVEYSPPGYANDVVLDAQVSSPFRSPRSRARLVADARTRTDRSGNLRRTQIKEPGPREVTAQFSHREDHKTASILPQG